LPYQKGKKGEERGKKGGRRSESLHPTPALQIGEKGGGKKKKKKKKGGRTRDRTIAGSAAGGGRGRGGEEKGEKRKGEKEGWQGIVNAFFRRSSVTARI